MAKTKYSKRYYHILPRGLPRETCKSCGETYVADPKATEEPCPMCWVMGIDNREKPEKSPVRRKTEQPPADRLF